jgi:iron complex transport system substrate-binding protein
MLARTDYCDYPPDVKNVESVGTLGSYNFERIVALAPDLILMMTFDGSSRREYDRLKELGLRPVAFAEGDLQSVIRTIDTVGRVIGRSERGSALAARLLRELDSIRSQNRGRDPVPVFIVIDQAPLMTVSGGFITSMIEAAGGRNVAEGNQVAYPRYSREALLTDRPEVILIPGLDPNAPARFLERYPEAAATPAGQNGRILTIDPNLLARPGPRVLEGVREIVISY